MTVKCNTTNPIQENTTILPLLFVFGEVLETEEEGQEVFEGIVEAIEKGRKLELVFRGVHTVTEPFLEKAFGQLFARFDAKDIIENLQLVSFPEEYEGLLGNLVGKATYLRRCIKMYEGTIYDTRKNK